MRLQREARVTVIIGNHDVLLLAARKFPRQFEQRWRESDGADRDLQRLGDAHVRWLSELPALSMTGDALLMHADALFYLDYGQTIEQVNAAFKTLLASDDPANYQRLLDQFGEHRAFLDCANVDRYVHAFGGRRLIHGHTPVPRLAQRPAETVTEPYVYCTGRCVDVDPGIYLGGPGFAYSL